MSGSRFSPLPITPSSIPPASPLPVTVPWSAVPFPQPAADFVPPQRQPLPSWPTPDTGGFFSNPAAAPPLEAPARENAIAPSPLQPPASPPPPDFTDQDLCEAFAPIFRQAFDYKALSAADPQLEPLLRATVRRALAENSANRPFRSPGMIDRFLWRMQALFTSRTYEDILFEKTRRFQVEEVFLLDSASLALISYASSDPARHSSPRRIEATVLRLASQFRDPNGNLRPSFILPDSRNVVSHQGQFITLLAVVRGIPSEMALNDLVFSIERIEERFRERFQTNGSALLQILQPFLEDCLLIQAPASAA